MSNTPVTLCYVRWLDAHFDEGEKEIADITQTCELEYQGILVKETEEAVSLSLENPHDGRTRNAFSISKRDIVDMRVKKTTFARAFPKPRAKRTVPTRATES
jgi:hypothetical protein